MSNYENKPGFGALFHNDKKEEGSKQPDYKGELRLLNGTDIRVAIWIKLDKSGKSICPSARISHTTKTTIISRQKENRHRE